MHKIIMACALGASVLLGACGGGGGSDGSPAVANVPATGGKSSSGTNNASNQGTSGGSSGNSGASGSDSVAPPTPTTNGGDSSGGTNGSTDAGSGTTPSGSDTSGGGTPADIGNTIPVLVSPVTVVRNFPLVSVTICQPGSGGKTNCATIDHVLLDTGSFGLRLFASVIPDATLAALPVQTDPVTGRNVAACANFGSGYTWGGLRTADVKMSAEVAASVPIQVIGDTAVSAAAPQSCVYNTALPGPDMLGANGILGVGVARYDCGAACAGTTPVPGYYYADGARPRPISMPLANQVANPVALFPVDNNGLIVDMPAVDANGAPVASGTVTFGIGTQSNNRLAGTGTTVLATDGWGNFKGSMSGDNAVQAFVDSGTNTLMFDDAAITQNSFLFYAPPATLKRTASLTDARGESVTVDVAIANADALFGTNNFAFNNLGAYLAQTVDLGMPFFYGKRVYYGIDAGEAALPYVAWIAP
ncbi:DUF3443 family protein [Paraburkholderia sp. Ac-20340]|uniref:DUF3443 family protein n=1 Tax=Paraburkholderia sp. Ac-20340 TaxID=2703888 RepID=UPI0019808DA8|nr:DUF3443 family protein [Paraburkholderia sp. Ac-20340]MBN3856534.1 DUF3443 family protein [Paraburkholderia sp. Ac-20340]